MLHLYICRGRVSRSSVVVYARSVHYVQGFSLNRHCMLWTWPLLRLFFEVLHLTRYLYAEKKILVDFTNTMDTKGISQVGHVLNNPSSDI